MEVALLGGSFNPPHVGHLLAAHFVRATQAVDEVWLMPSYRHPFGKALARFEHRLAMCELLCRDTSGWMRAVDVERHVPGEGRTVDTLEHLTQVHPEVRFTLVMGSDLLRDLPSWKNFPRIQELARVLVVNRSGFPDPRALGPPLPEVSSTAVREALQRGEEPVGLVPRVVLEYLRTHPLYAR